MIGINDIASYIPARRISNFSRREELNISDEFIIKKIGVQEIAVRAPDEDCSDLCVKAFRKLQEKHPDLNRADAMIVVTQNPDYSLPHSSAIVHGKLKLNSDCACFDISLGCSGFVYALSVIQAFMSANGMETGLLFTSDPYSKIIDPKDKNTSLLFGDGAAVTLINTSPVYTSGPFTFGTLGKDYRDLICENGILSMNGRSVFNFAAKTVPPSISDVITKAGLQEKDITRYIFHQGSKFIVDTLTKRLELDPGKVAFSAASYGNTVSSSIPMMLEKELDEPPGTNLVICGFGVGLSWASTVLSRYESD